MLVSNIIKTVCVILLSYLVGSFNPSYLLAKTHGYDIRKHGSGNAGASNVVIMMGKKAGIIVALMDIIKAYIVVRASLYFCDNNAIFGAMSATSVILGHIFPFYMNFKGGKGFATLGGSVLALDPKVFIVLLICAIIIAVVTNYICFAPMSISVIFAIIYGYVQKSIPCFIILMIAAVTINLRHRENIRRIKDGTEARFSLLWDRKSEAERLGKQYDEEKGYESTHGEILNKNKENN